MLSDSHSLMEVMNCRPSYEINGSSSQISVFSSDNDVSSSQGDVGSSKVVINDLKR